MVQAASDRKTTVFISYRRETGFFLAKYIFDYLHAAGYDVFMDVHSLGAGEFEQTTLAEVAARDYFLLVLTSGNLQGMTSERDWLRKELMQAVKSGRTVVPVVADGFKFEDHRVQEVLEKLPRALQSLPSFNAVRIPPPEYFDSAMKRLISFLKAPADSTPSLGTDKSSDTAAAPKSVAQAQSVLHELTLPPVTSLTKIQSATPWSDLQATLAGAGGAGTDAPALKESSPTSSKWLAKLTTRPRLPAPTLRWGPLGGLRWTEVREADKYVLEESGDAEFKGPGEVVYQGPGSRYFARAGPVKYYRVKAIGKGAAGESGWSNIVMSPTAKRAFPYRLPAPYLRRGPLSNLRWTEVREADKYVLEESSDAEFKDPGEVVYQGPRNYFARAGPVKYYRVKAIGKIAEGDWSNIVGGPHK
jgi:hypothetical protein